jgi:hypothetical protein
MSNSFVAATELFSACISDQAQGPQTEHRTVGPEAIGLYVRSSVVGGYFPQKSMRGRTATPFKKTKIVSDRDKPDPSHENFAQRDFSRDRTLER